MKKIMLNVEFSADFSLVGWAIDIEKKEFPKNILLVSPEVSKDIIIEANINRPEINNMYGVPQSNKVGFKVNLFDVFNSQITNYSIRHENKNIWLRKDSLNKINHTVVKKNIPFPKEHGKKQVVFIYEEGDYFFKLISILNSWNKNIFLKKYSAGVSYYFVTLSNFGSKKKLLLSNKNDKILIIPRVLYEKTFQLSPAFCNLCHIFLLEDLINLDIDFHGIMSVICKLAKISNGTKIDALVLFRIFEVITSYNSLLFDQETELYTYQWGSVESWMNKRIKKIYQEEIKPDIVILSKQKIQRFSELSEVHLAIFVKTSSWRFLLDLPTQNINYFIHIAYKRGMRIQISNAD